MTMTLLIGVAVSVMDGFYTGPATGTPMRELLVIFVVSLCPGRSHPFDPNVIARVGSWWHAASSGSDSFSAGAIAGAAVAPALLILPVARHWPPPASAAGGAQAPDSGRYGPAGRMFLPAVMAYQTL